MEINIMAIIIVLVAINILLVIFLLYQHFTYKAERKKIKLIFKALTETLQAIYKQYEPFAELEPLTTILLKNLIEIFAPLGEDNKSTIFRGTATNSPKNN
jgi:hypothetical protein